MSRSSVPIAATGPRGRPTLKRAQELNNILIEAAHRMFLREGYSHVSMEAVAAEARVSKGTLYSRFPSKETLFAAMVETRVSAWSKRASAGDSAMGRSLRKRLEHHVEVSLISMADPEIQAFNHLLTSEARRFPELARIFHDTAVRFEVDLLAREIAAAAARDGKPARNPRAVADAIVQMVWGWNLMQSMRGATAKADTWRRAARRIVGLIMDGRDAW